MIHDIGQALQAKLREAGFKSALVVDGPESTETATWGRERIVIEHDDGGDRFSHVRSQRRNPDHVATREVGAKIRVYAQSTKQGAQDWEHRRRAEKIVDQIVVALGKIAADETPIYNVWEPTSGRFFTPADLEISARKGGAAYELGVTFARAVMVKTWAGDIAEEVTVGTDVEVETAREASVDGTNFETF